MTTSAKSTDNPQGVGPGGASLAKAYQPAEAEPRIRARWEAANAFRADPGRVLSGERKPFAIVIPPPNVTGALHLGHALNNTLQDILTRAKRMQGYEALWMPGADHAGIATQTVVEKRVLAPRGQKRTDFDRDAFIAMVQEWKDEYEQRIKGQLLAMGCSCDFGRWRFTMDDICARAVREAFFRLFKAGLIYRGKRLVNWDPVSQTALADDEVEMRDVEGFFHYLRYPLVHQAAEGDHSPVTWGELAARGYPGADEKPDDERASVTVATTRPETYLGDTAVAVNPKDPRAGALKGLYAELPLVGRVVPIIEDDYVVLPDPKSDDPKAQYATGFLKVTPAHDPNDWEIGQRHNLRIINIFAPDATISAVYGWADVGDASIFVGKSREEARELVIKEFEARGLLEGSRPYTHGVGHSYRSHAAIEPYLSDQWYVKVSGDSPLREFAQSAVVGEQRTSPLRGAGLRPVTSSPLRGTGLRPVTTAPTSSPSDAALRPVTPDLDRETFPEIAPPGFIGCDPYPSGRSGPTPDLMGFIRNLPHCEIQGATYFVTWRTKGRRTLTANERDTVLDAIKHWDGERCRVYLTTVMPDHVHAVVRPFEGFALGEWVGGVKKFTARVINESAGDIGSLWQDERFDHIVRDDSWFAKFVHYILWNPVEAGLVDKPSGYRWTAVHDEVLAAVGRGAHRSESGATQEGCSQAGTRPGDGQLRFFPDRYAKMYESWHDNIRDWCISRQLWWGHRIPVWTKQDLEVSDAPLIGWLARRANEGQVWLCIGSDRNRTSVREFRDDSGEVSFDVECEWVSGDPSTTHVCVRDPDGENGEIIQRLETAGFERDPDVLDTWFSSALWPLSTMGWPEPDERTEGLLEAFHPTDVLSTAREILTLWVSRMVMFSRFFTQDESDEQRRTRIPFKDVYIHAVVQDGEGKRMSKSAGNGVDPLDIIHSHGADAMRYTLCQMTTQTQDVRMPVEHDAATGRNTSPKFDLGKRFCNKLWNASRFTLMMIDEAEAGGKAEPTLIDRWMLSRLAASVRDAERALANYQFSEYAQVVYDLLWRDFCDWYLEGVKPTVRTNPAQRAVLRASLDCILRLLHPVCPFVTEAVYEALQASPHPGGVEGVALAPSDDGSGLLCRSAWPAVDGSLRSEAIEADFERLRELITQIRDVRSQQGVPPRTRITLHAHKDLAQRVEKARGLVETLAGLERVTTDGAPAASTPMSFEGAEVRLSGLTEQQGGEAERARLEKRIDELAESIAVLDKRLANPGYTDKAPAHLVQQTRDQRDALAKELETTRAALESLA